VWPVRVVVGDVLAQNRLEPAARHDQDPVETFTPDAADPALGARFRPRRRDRRLDREEVTLEDRGRLLAEELPPADLARLGAGSMPWRSRTFRTPLADSWIPSSWPNAASRTRSAERRHGRPGAATPAAHAAAPGSQAPSTAPNDQRESAARAASASRGRSHRAAAAAAPESITSCTTAYASCQAAVYSGFHASPASAAISPRRTSPTTG
jgi:hypothetical protein